MNRIGIVIPVYNSGSKLSKTVESILSQVGIFDLQILLIDDFSTDIVTRNLLSELSEIPIVTVTYNDRNIGICNSRNKGLKLLSASTDFVMFVDHDDVLDPLAFQKFMMAFNDNPHSIAVIGIAYKFGPMVTAEDNESFIDSQAKRRMISFCNRSLNVSYETTNLLTYPIILSSYTIHPPAKAMLRTAALVDSGVTFDRRFELVEDWIFWIKLLKWGQIQTINEVTAGYFWHDSNNSQRKKQVTQVKKAWHFLFWYSINSQKDLVSYICSTTRNRIDAVQELKSVKRQSTLVKVKIIYNTIVILIGLIYLRLDKNTLLSDVVDE